MKKEDFSLLPCHCLQPLRPEIRFLLVNEHAEWMWSVLSRVTTAMLSSIDNQGNPHIS